MLTVINSCWSNTMLCVAPFMPEVKTALTTDSAYGPTAKATLIITANHMMRQW